MDPNGILGDISLAEFGIPSWNGDHIRLDVHVADMERTVEYHTLGWSSFERLYGAPPGQHATREIFDTTSSRGLDPTMRYERQWGVDPISTALHEASAPTVNASESLDTGWK